MRQVVIDTETTGLDPARGDRIIEIACIELINRRLTGRHFHAYVNPERAVSEGVVKITGLTDEFLADKPLFREIADKLIEFIRDADLIAHNAVFDVHFLNTEFSRLGFNPVTEYCPTVTDTLIAARSLHPGERNNLDALCARYHIEGSNASFHGALLDAELVAELYLAAFSTLYDRPTSVSSGLIEPSIRSIENETLSYFAKNPHQMHAMLTPRRFEELVAAIFRNNGFTVQLTPQTRDGGVDIIAVEHSVLTGDTIHLIECKRYGKSQRVGVGVVQRLLGAVTQKRATKGIVVATSYFTSDAKNAAEEARHIMTLSDYDVLVAWLRSLRIK